MKKTGKQNIRWNTMKILAVGFLSVIFLGAVLLWMRFLHQHHRYV